MLHHHIAAMPLVDGAPPEPEITIGGDPEFEAWDPSAGCVVLPPSRHEHVDDTGDIGLDGARTVAELRPYAANDPEALYRRIRTLADRWEQITGLRVCLSGHRYPAGCHIHIGASYPHQLVGDWEAFIKDLDLVLGGLVKLSGQARGKYRVRRAYRAKAWGVEYRSLPAAILAFPELALWCFRTALAVAKGEQPPKRDTATGLAVKRLREAVRTGDPFTWDLRRLEKKLAVTLSPRDTWSDGWRRWLFDLQPRLARQPIHFFGMAEWRGLATNWWRLAEMTGWALYQDVEAPNAPEGAFPVGLPYAVRTQQSPDPLTCRQIVACLADAGLINP
jgi:hypothetical protein